MKVAAVARLLTAIGLIGVAGCASRGPSESPRAQLAFGVQMAERGLWQEALFRFEQARRQEPNNVRVLNNLAVSYEAVGRYDDALAAYRAALQAAPEQSKLRQNYTRFVEFYQSFRAKPAGAAAAAPVPPAASGAPAPPAPGPPPAAPPPGEPPTPEPEVPDLPPPGAAGNA
jgi:Tfp pilus assembly protein PilF